MAHGFLGIGLNVPHVRLHHVQRVVVHHLQQKVNAALVGRDLRFEVREIVGKQSCPAHGRFSRTPRQRARFKQQLRDALFVEHAVFHELEALDARAFLDELAGERRHGAGRDAADVSMMASAGDKKDWAPIPPNRGDDRDVRKVAASGDGVVGNQHVAFPQIFTLKLDLAAHGVAHRPKMHRNVRGVGDEATGFVKDRAGEIEPFLDVRGNRSALERAPHLLRDRHEEVAEDGKLDGVRLRADFALSSGFNRDDDIAELRDFGKASGFDEDGRGVLHEDRRAVQPLSRAKLFEQENRRVVPAALKVAAGVVVGLRGFGFLGNGEFLQPRRFGDRPHPHVVHQDVAVGEFKAELAAVGFLERLCKVGKGHGRLQFRTRIGKAQPAVGQAGVVGCGFRLRNHQRGVGALIAQVEEPLDFDVFRGMALGKQFVTALLGEGVQSLGKHLEGVSGLT